MIQIIYMQQYWDNFNIELYLKVLEAKTLNNKN